MQKIEFFVPEIYFIYKYKYIITSTLILIFSSFFAGYNQFYFLNIEKMYI